MNNLVKLLRWIISSPYCSSNFSRNMVASFIVKWDEFFSFFFFIVCAEIFSLIIQIMKARLILRFELWRWQKNSEQKELINRYHWLLQGKETNITCTYFCGFVIPLILVISLVVIYIIFCFLAPKKKKKKSRKLTCKSQHNCCLLNCITMLWNL